MSSALQSGAPPSLAEIIRPPNRPEDSNKTILSVFLAGPTSSQHTPDWRARLSNSLTDLPILLLDPRNKAWDSTWREDCSDSRWAAQVKWEMTMRAQADVVVCFFEAGSDSPVSLLELGLSLGAQTSRMCVFAAKDYSKRGYVRAACDAFGVGVEDHEEVFVAALRSTLARLLESPNGA